jgi:tetratricopeptide (TPR) repeat protein
VLLVTASRQRRLAQDNLRIAADAVDQLLVSIDRDPTTIGADVPQMQQLRQTLLERARPFYDRFLEQNPSDDILSDMAFAHLRLGDINRMLDDTEAAVLQYERAIANFEGLAERNPAEPEYRRSLAAAHSGLGETLRPLPEAHTRAETAYGRALALQEELVRQAPGNPAYVQEFARTHYNRGILYGETAQPGEPPYARAEADFREAIRLLETLPTLEADPQASQDLGRAVNNLASLIDADSARMSEARPLFERAVRLHEALLDRRPDTREYALELATFSNNLSVLLRRSGDTAGAEARNEDALRLLEQLARPAPSLGIEQADAHNLRGRILESRSANAALAEYRRALAGFQNLARSVNVSQLPAFHRRFSELLYNVGSLSRQQPNLAAASQLLAEAARAYVSLGERALAEGLIVPAETIVQNLSDLSPEFADRDRRTVAALSRALQEKIR